MNLATPLGPLASDFERTGMNWWDGLQLLMYAAAVIALVVAVETTSDDSSDAQKGGKRTAVLTAAGSVVVALLLAGLSHFVVGDLAQQRVDASAKHNLELMSKAYPDFTVSTEAAACAEEITLNEFFLGPHTRCAGIDKVAGDRLVRIWFAKADGRVIIMAPTSKHAKDRVITSDADLLAGPGADKPSDRVITSDTDLGQPAQ
jgi:hypothetical protein